MVQGDHARLDFDQTLIVYMFALPTLDSRMALDHDQNQLDKDDLDVSSDRTAIRRMEAPTTR